MKTVKIIPMSAEHLDALASLERICFSRPWSRQMLADELDNQCAAFLVALEPETEKVIGYAGLLVAADEGYITNVAVDPSRRRQGVAANSLIRADLQAACEKTGVKLYLPPLKWCGDNGAMIGSQGYYEYQAGRTAGLDLNAYATMDLGDPVF